MPPTLPNTLTNGTTADAAQVMANFNAINAGVGQSTITSLPASPYDGQEIDYLADAANGVVWHLKYRSASPSAYKWEYIGGAHLRSAISYEATKVAAGISTPADFTTPISITLPLAGDYDLEASGARNLANTTAVGTNVNVIVSSGTLVGYHPDGGFEDLPAQFSGKALSVAPRLTGAAAGATAKLQWLHSNTVASVNYAGIALRVCPVRVG